MLTKSDIVIIGNLFDEKLGSVLDKKLDEVFDKKFNEHLRPFREEINERFFSLEERLNDRFSLIDARFVALEQAIYDVREDVADLRTSMRAFAVSLDVLTKSMSEMRMEYSAINIQLARHEEWIQKLADKAGIKFA